MIKLIKSTFYHEEETKQKLVDFILRSQMLSMSDQCRQFEESFARKQKRKYAVFTNSGSSGNLILIQALLNLGLLKKGDKVGFSALTWSTNVMPLIQLGLQPVAIDCELATLNVSPEKLAEVLPDLKGLFLTNVLGFADDIVRIKQMCAEKNVLLLEDNCEALGSEVGGALLGNFSLASVFSLFVGHHLSAIEGGVVCTDSEELRDMLVLARAHGWDRNLPEEKQKQLRASHGVDDFYAKYAFYDLAYNARPTEINGFLGNIQLGFWDEIVAKRQENFKKCNEKISANDDFVPFALGHMNVVSNFGIPIVCRDKETSERYKKKFTDADVEVRPIIAGDITRQPFYKKYVSDGRHCANSDFIHQNGFYFANNPELTEEEVNLLCSLSEK